MTSFINTMFVHSSPPQPYSTPPRPLPALHSDILARSESHHSMDPASPQSVYHSPLQRHIQHVFDSDNYSPNHNNKKSSKTNNSTRDNIPVPVRHEYRHPDTHRDKKAMGYGFVEVATTKADIFSRSNSNARTQRSAFQPAKRTKGTSGWQLKQFAEATLGSGSLRKVVQLPEGEDRDEWLAVNVVDFYNQINLLYGAITEFCSPTTCPEMKATDEFEYLWHDPPTFPKPTRLPAPTYISHLLSWTSAHLFNSTLFPTHPGVPFPSNFSTTIRTIFKRLYRVYAHIYCHHYGVVRGLGLEPHLNTGFKHYVLFVEEFGLSDAKGDKKGEWYGPLGELVESMLRSD